MKSDLTQVKKNKKKERDLPENSKKNAASKQTSTRSKKSVNTQKASPKSAPKSASNKSSSSRKKTRLWAWIKFSFATAIVLCLVFIALFDVSRVTSNAMMPALSRGDLVLSWAPILIDKKFQDGDIILVQNERDTEPNYLRLIANHNEVVDFHDDELSVNGTRLNRLRLTNDAIVRPVEEPEFWRETLPTGARYRIMLPQQTIVGALKGSICAEHGAFLAGDNRMASYDSRQNGLYDESRLRGQVLLVLETVRHDGVLGPWLKWVD